MGLIKDNNQRVVVISHDCDLAQRIENEPNLEVIVGNLLAQANGNNTHAKNPRSLHLPATEEDKTIILELLSKDKLQIPKEPLIGFSPDPTRIISAESKKILQNWLASKYRRTAFPDKLDEYLENTKLAEKIKTTLSPMDSHITAIFFDIDGGETIEHTGDNDPYKIGIYLVYNIRIDPDQASEEAEAACKKIKEHFTRVCFKDGKWTKLELTHCTPVSEVAFTFYQSQMLHRWSRTDSISLKSETDPPAD